MASLTDMRTALRDKIDDVTGLRAYATLPDEPLTPCAIVRPVSAEFHESFDDDTTLRFEVIVLAHPLQDGAARGQEKLDAYLTRTGSTSIKAAIEADRTLGGKVEDTTVTGWTEYGSLIYNDVEYVGAKLLVTVLEAV